MTPEDKLAKARARYHKKRQEATPEELPGLNQAKAKGQRLRRQAKREAAASLTATSIEKRF